MLVIPKKMPNFDSLTVLSNKKGWFPSICSQILNDPVLSHTAGDTHINTNIWIWIDSSRSVGSGCCHTATDQKLEQDKQCLLDENKTPPISKGHYFDNSQALKEIFSLSVAAAELVSFVAQTLSLETAN